MENNVEKLEKNVEKKKRDTKHVHSSQYLILLKDNCSQISQYVYYNPNQNLIKVYCINWQTYSKICMEIQKDSEQPTQFYREKTNLESVLPDFMSYS